MARKLVTVRRIGATQPINGADRIEVAVVDGWRCIVERGQFVAGDLGVFFEIDSFLPGSDARWTFLAEKFIVWGEEKGFRVRSQKMRGQVSQGLLEPLTSFPEIAAVLDEMRGQHGTETAERLIRDMPFEDVLGVRKWEPMENTSPHKTVTAPFPSFIRRTDQERCQNLPAVFEEWKDKEFQVSTKMDGSSMTVYFLRNDSEKIQLLPTPGPDGTGTETQQGAAFLPNGRFGVCSRHIDLREGDANGHYFWEVAKRLDLPDKLSRLDRNIALQGELCGSSIQKNFEGFPPKVHDFFLFSIWDIDAQSYVKPREVEIMAQELQIKHVHVTGYSRLGDIASDVQELLVYAEGKGLFGKKREGIVLKHIEGDFSFKAISNSYLLKHGE